MLTLMVAQVCASSPANSSTPSATCISTATSRAGEAATHREPRPLPQMKLNPTVKNIHDFQFEDFETDRLRPTSAIKAPIAV